MDKKTVELLAPAGQWESLVAAIEAGGNVTLHPMCAALKNFTTKETLHGFR